MKTILATGALSIAALIAGPAAAQDVDGLLGAVAGELAPNCAAGSRLSFDRDQLSRNADGTVSVNLGGFDCQWEFTNHPFCGMRACEVRTYRPSGGSWTLTGSALR